VLVVAEKGSKILVPTGFLFSPPPEAEAASGTDLFSLQDLDSVLAKRCLR
jgi:hypothetical protein